MYVCACVCVCMCVCVLEVTRKTLNLRKRVVYFTAKVNREEATHFVPEIDRHSHAMPWH